jgi:murein DD-endopeptidase MepM/ murein hydrolase activator NlpD
MNLKLVSRRTGKVRQYDLSQPKTLLALAGVGLAVVALVFGAGMQVGRVVAGPLADERLAKALEQQKIEIQAARGQLQGKIDAMASRVGMMNAHLIRLDALGRRITDLANLDHGEFNFDEPPPAGGPEVSVPGSGSAAAPELTAVLPVIGGWISSRFGFRTDPITGHNAFHPGVDLAAVPGSKVVATGPGVVSFAGFKTGYGNVVEITHPTGYVTRYAHNSRNLVHEGDEVDKGQPVAIIGSTGRSTGTHVHFEVERNGHVVDPAQYLDAP